ncbi:MAG: ABC transporter ATP-binding protein [Bdellovibrionales bacterium]
MEMTTDTAIPRAALCLTEVSKSFRQGDTQLKVLDGLSLQLHAGEVVAVVGESGSGKSTLLSLLAGFDSPDQGDIHWDKESTATWSDQRWAEFRKRSMGFVFQNYHLIPYLTALENAALPLRLLRTAANADHEAAALLTQLGLGARLDHLPNQLSGGECQRTAIARATVHHPRLILADEPTGSLDSQTGHTVLAVLFRLLRERRQTALIVTHSQDVAARCDRVLHLRQGRLWPA